MFAACGWLLTACTVAIFVLGFLVIRWVVTRRSWRLEPRW
jgi:hypothetical protein